MGAGAVYVVKLHEVSLNQIPDSSDWYESMSSIDTGTGFYGNLIKMMVGLRLEQRLIIM